jgi:hypothetical protein
MKNNGIIHWSLTLKFEFKDTFSEVHVCKIEHVIKWIFVRTVSHLLVYLFSTAIFFKVYKRNDTFIKELLTEVRLKLTLRKRSESLLSNPKSVKV